MMPFNPAAASCLVVMAVVVHIPGMSLAEDGKATKPKTSKIVLTAEEKGRTRRPQSLQDRNLQSLSRPQTR